MIVKYFFIFYFIKGMFQIFKILNVDIKMGYMINFDVIFDIEQLKLMRVDDGLIEVCEIQDIIVKIFLKQLCSKGG